MPAPRVRFAPAPSGWLHVGGARTALYNWLHARGGRGAFVLRVEDTDADRVSEESYTGLIEALRFLGLDWDEGPGVGGPYGPYRQSQRLDLHRGIADALLAAGHAYEAFETEEELTAQREQAQREGRPPGYAGAHRNLTSQQRADLRAEGRTSVLRLRTPDEGTVAFDDAVRGTVEVAWKDIGDFVIARADRTPTYYLANTVDDLAMGINLIARGEDLLAATPRQILIGDHLLAGGLLDDVLAQTGMPARPDDAVRPAYAHLPLLVGADRKPLSKRHGSVAVDEFRRQGFLPDVLVNFLALCGWSYDGTTEKFTVDELVEKFSFDRVGRNPAAFDTDKLRAMNGDRIKELTDAELAAALEPALQLTGVLPSPAVEDQRALLLAFAPLLRERIQTLADAEPLVAWAFRDTVTWDEAAAAKHLRADVLLAAAEALATVQPWDDAAILAALDGVASALELGRGKAFQAVRVGVTGAATSPPLPESLALLDRDSVVRRLTEAVDRAPT